ncbi:MAG: malonyl-CoA decarboxylase domain-containing protein [Cypionkella sp.]
MLKFGKLNADEKLRFFNYLGRDLDIDVQAVSRLAAVYATDASSENYVALQAACEPARQELLRRLNHPAGATAVLVAMRVDLMALLKMHPHLPRIDFDFLHLLRSWFNRGFLVLRQINWNISANILEKIVEYEAVHEIKDWSDLRRRIHPPDRRCFAFFHPTMPVEPLIFVEIALTPEIPNSIDALLSDAREAFDTTKVTTAVFYSISNCQAGLAGVSFGSLLIKQVAEKLSREFPQLRQYVTLSPIPGLMRWLEETGQTVPAGAIRDATAYYLLNAKRPDGSPVDAVSRFHLGNGATVHAVHADADKSEKAAAQSFGVMVNYLYDLSKTERNHEAFASGKTIASSKPVQLLAKAHQDVVKEGLPQVNGASAPVAANKRL